MQERSIRAGVLTIAYLEYGASDGWPCVLSHGFPYAPDCFRESAAMLAAEGARVITPFLRGYGPTRFLSDETMRSGEQAALGADLLALLDALDIERAVLGGYDWGGRASCVVSALFPERVAALVSGAAYNIQDIPNSTEPVDPEEEAAYWYQYYFHGERGRRGLTRRRRDIARLLWRTWSPTWNFSEAEFEDTASAFDNSDFVDVVLHSYRHRFGLTPGDPAYAELETRLAAQPAIATPTVTLDGAVDGVHRLTLGHAAKFVGPHEHRVLEGVGHNPPQEAPRAWTLAVLRARALAEEG